MPLPTGITPIFAMARSLQARKASFCVFYAGLERSSMAYLPELERLCGDRLIMCESKRNSVPDLAALLARQAEETTAYICGPGGMIEALRNAGSSLGWSRERIRFEVFNSAHRADDEDFEVRLKSGHVIKVGAGTTILDALESIGVDTLSDCRRGECGLCITDVIGCRDGLDHRDRYFSKEEHDAGRQITICCSRIKGRVLELDI